MYVPPLDSILRSFGMSRSEYEMATSVAMPKEMFKLLMQVALANSDFNETGYLKENPDVADGMRRGNVEDARLHYIGFGFFEGRLGGTPAVDERWYLTTYSDVAQAVKLGKVASAREHYNVIGGSEGRSPRLKTQSATCAATGGFDSSFRTVGAWSWRICFGLLMSNGRRSTRCFRATVLVLGVWTTGGSSAALFMC